MGDPRHHGGAIGYRRDIDGLRGVAVIAVVLFHAGAAPFAGGFVGVDIFFVISGFLITSIIVKALEADSFSIARFYERRVRRLFPALFVLLVFCLCVAHVLLPPAPYDAFGRSLVASSGFGSNVLFWLEAGYFTPGAESKPLLHTWSLAVEEQFYVVFPVLLIVLYRWRRQWVRPVLAVLAVASFALGVWGTFAIRDAAFYLAPFRAWELLAGSLISIGAAPHFVSQRARDAAGVIGLLLIGWSVAASDPSQFPGLQAAVPVAGTVLLIHAGSSGPTFAGRMLGGRSLVFFGLISYSLYLWHWPLLAFARYWRLAPLTPGETAAVLVAALVIAIGSWWFVERPVRRGWPARRTTLFTSAAAATLVILVVGGVVVTTDGLPGRYGPAARLYTAALTDHIDKSCVNVDSHRWLEQGCVFGDTAAADDAFVIWGDSHAYAYAPALAHVGEALHVRGRLASKTACPPLLGLAAPQRGPHHMCREHNDAILEAIKPGQLVFLIARWAYYEQKSLINREGPVYVTDDTAAGLSDANNRRSLASALARTLDMLKAKGAEPVIVSSLPEFPLVVPDLFLRLGQARIARGIVDQRVAWVDALLARTASASHISLIDPKSVLCDAQWCDGSNESGVLFFDNDHLTSKGALFVSPLFRAAFAGRAQAARLFQDRDPVSLDQSR